MFGNLTSHIYIKDAWSLSQTRGLPSLIYHELAIEVRFVRGPAGTTSILAIRDKDVWQQRQNQIRLSAWQVWPPAQPNES